MKFWRILLIGAISLSLIAFIGCGKAEEQPESETETTTPEAEEVIADYTPTADEIGTEAVCQVCKMTVTVAAETPAVMYDGQPYYFCTADEKTAFAADPEKYLAVPEETPSEGETPSGDQ